MLSNDGKSIGGTAVMRNPGIAMLWTTKEYSVFDDGNGGRLIHMGAPLGVQWYAFGRIATRQEVLDSIESGYPTLATIALQQEGAMKYLEQCRAKLETYLPGE